MLARSGATVPSCAIVPAATSDENHAEEPARQKDGPTPDGSVAESALSAFRVAAAATVGMYEVA